MHGRIRGLRENSCCATDLCVWWRSICHSSSFMVVWTRMWVCGGAAFLSRAGLHATFCGAVWPRLCDPLVHGALGVMAVYKPGWANLQLDFDGPQ